MKHNIKNKAHPLLMPHFMSHIQKYSLPALCSQCQLQPNFCTLSLKLDEKPENHVKYSTRRESVDIVEYRSYPRLRQ